MKLFLAFLAFIVLSFLALVLSTGAGPQYVLVIIGIAIFVMLCLIYGELEKKK